MLREIERRNERKERILMMQEDKKMQKYLKDSFIMRILRIQTF